MPAPKKRLRKVPLNVTVGEAIRAKGHEVAYRRGRSLSELVAEFILKLDREDHEQHAVQTKTSRARRTRG